MPINPNIAMGVNPIRVKQRDPFEEFSKQSQLQALMTSQADDQLTRDAMRESGGDTESALKRLISGGGSLKAITGLQGMADARAKAKSETAYREAQTGKLLSEAEASEIAKHRDMLSMVHDLPSAAAWVKSGYSNPAIGKRLQSLGTMEQAIQNIPQDPAAFQTWLQKQSLGATKFIEMNKPVLSNRNLGNVDELTSTPGMGGAPTVLSSRPILESEAQRLSRERQAADAKAGRDVTMRGQNMTDARSRESTAASISKPFEVTGEDGKPVLVRQDKAGNITPVQGYGPKSGADKPLTDAQSKAALFGSRMESANKVLESLATSGTTTSIPGARTGFGVGAGLNVVSSGNQQKLNQAKRDFVNAVLRRESGAVISDAEFDNAEKQYFPQVGEGPEVKAQKLANRQIAIRGVQAEVPKAQRGVLAEIQGQPKAGGVVDFGSLK